MKALLSKTAGGPDALVLEDVPSPEPGKGEVVIDVKAVGVNYPDVLIIQDMYQFKPERPFSPGGELSGIVKAVGEGVTKVKVGDRVMGSIGWGGMAEEAKVDEGRVRPFPDSMSFEEAAALLTDEARKSLRKAALFFAAAPAESDAFDTAFKAWMEDEGLKMRDVGLPLRAALTGTKTAPSILDIVRGLGTEETIKRINQICT